MSLHILHEELTLKVELGHFAYYILNSDPMTFAT